MAGAVQVEANLQGQLGDYLQVYYESVRQRHGGNFRNGTIRWKISGSIRVIFHIFVPALTVFEILSFEKVGQGHGKQLSQWRHSMANIKICKAVSRIFVLALIISDILTFHIFDLEK